LVTWILNRLPDRRQFWPVFSTVIFIVFTWTIYRALYQVPSWLFYMKIPGVLVLLAYILGFALLESLLVSAFLAAYCFFLPERWLRINFAAQGLLLAILLALSAYLLRREFDTIQKLGTWQMAAILPALALLIALVAPLLAMFLSRFPKLVGWLEMLGNRMTVFSYIYIPLGVLGWFVVVIRILN
jgi:hypothetical protein